jgi:GNAT superfamily N-acetyltransferase
VSGLEATAELLSQVFPDSHVASTEYLRWLYLESPFGPVIETNLDDDRGRVGHYALVPVTIARDGVDHPAALSLDTAVHERARGGGVFVKLGASTIERAAELGVESVVGVANASSTPGFERRLDFELLTPLPASVMLPLPGSTAAITSRDVHAGEPHRALGEVESLLGVPARGEGRRWTAETLAWRLRRPGASYALHRSSKLLAVTCAARRAGVRVAIVLKVFAAAALSGAEARALVTAACRHHRAPLALHVGLNDLVDFRGIALPGRLRPSPLNLIYRSLVTPAREASIARFEFLDFDAY